MGYVERLRGLMGELWFQSGISPPVPLVVERDISPRLHDDRWCANLIGHRGNRK